MKTNRNIIIGLFFTTLFFSCSNNELLDLNKDTNSSDVIELSYLLPFGQLQVSGGRFENWRGNLIYSSAMIQHNASLDIAVSGNTFAFGDKYLYEPDYSAALWNTSYVDPLKTLTHVVDRTKEDDEQQNLYAMALLMRCFTLHRLTDFYGDIPYKQAGRGLDGQSNWFPKYESQQEVYDLLISQIREARDKLNDSGESLEGQDVMYNGKIDKWKKFANSLLLRVGMRMSKVDAAKAQSTVEEAATHAAGVFASNEDNAFIDHTDGEGINRNGNSEVFMSGGEHSNVRPSEFFVNWMKNNDDPRLLIICGGVGDPKAKSSSWNTTRDAQVGLPNGYDEDGIPEKALADSLISDVKSFRDSVYSFINPKLYNHEDPMFFVTHAETAFILAEAKEKGWNVGTTSAEEHFNAGVKSALQNWEAYDASLAVPDTTATAYIDGIGYDTATNKMKLIGEQYWAATYFNHYESFANWRRTGFPELTPVIFDGNVTNGTIPRRLRYPENELSGNSQAYQEAVARQGPDLFTTRMWWDTQ